MKTGNIYSCLIVSPDLHNLLLRKTIKYPECLISPGQSRMSFSSVSGTQDHMAFPLPVHDLVSNEGKF